MSLLDQRFATVGVFPTVAEAMMPCPKVCDPATTVAEARAMFADDHVHAVLVVNGDILLAVVERADLVTAGNGRAVDAGQLAHRVVGPAVHLTTARRHMDRTGTRRLAVVDADSRLLGLLCLKRNGRGFCSDLDVRARAADVGSSLRSCAGVAVR